MNMIKLFTWLLVDQFKLSFGGGGGGVVHKRLQQIQLTYLNTLGRM